MHIPCVDIVIPLSCESCRGNFELQMALRSIDRYVENRGNIYIVGDQTPAWLQNVTVLPVKDKHRHNKDANIIDKLLAAAAVPALSRRFLFWSDDQLALQRFDAAALPPAHNNRRTEHFSGKSVWHRRMRRTLEYLAEQGRDLAWNWDSHLPQPLNKQLFTQVMQSVDYAAEPGYCVNTLYFGLTGALPVLAQQQIKATVESNVILRKLPADKIFLGYNDAACKGDLPELLQKHFPHRCRYEL